MEILLHICCGPCLIYPFKRLKEQGYNIQGFYYNPNIYPAQEYRRRQDALEILSKDLSFTFQAPQYQQEDFFQAIAGQENTSKRCKLCWSLRLTKTAKAAREKGIPYFSTTLLVSPYQDHETLRQLGQEIAKESKVAFYYEDFRPGFKQAQAEAKLRGIYRQKYCGCKYSAEKVKL